MMTDKEKNVKIPHIQRNSQEGEKQWRKGGKMKKNLTNHVIRKRFNGIIYNIARYTEVALSVVILIVIASVAVSMIRELAGIPISSMNSEFFTGFLSNALSLVIGVEFVKMMCKLTAETLIEVMMFAIARQMIVEHLRTWETLIGVVAIAVLFIIRKYLLLGREASENMDGDRL